MALSVESMGIIMIYEFSDLIHDRYIEMNKVGRLFSAVALIFGSELNVGMTLMDMCRRKDFVRFLR